MAEHLFYSYLTTAEVAAARGVSYRQVIRAIHSGKLPAQRIGRTAVIARADLERWQTGRRRDAAQPDPPPLIDPGQLGIRSPHLAVQVLEQTALLEATVASIPDGIIITDEQGRLLYANPLVYEMMGAVPVESAARFAQWDVRDADGNPLDATAGPVARALRGERVSGQLLRARSVDGTPRFASASAAPIRLPDGQVRGVVVILRDITPEEEYRRQLAREREQLRALLDNSPVGILIVDASDMVIRQANANADPMLGSPEFPPHTMDECMAMKHAWLANGELCPYDRLPLVRALQGEHCFGLEIEIAQPDGRRVPILVNSAPLYGEDGRITGAIAAYQDITRLKETERQRDAFISMATHELRSPLAAIRGHVQLLQRRALRAQSADLPDLATVLDQTGRLRTLIDELLDMSRLQLGRLELQRHPTDLHELAVKVVEQAAANNAAHQFRLHAHGPTVGNWDPFRLEQVLVNLVSNAVKYSPEGGVITVAVDQDGAAPTREDGMIEVTVTDQGIGIPAGQEEAIFEQFHRAEHTQQAQSMGLGLYIARGIVEKHGGRLWAESPGPGCGSTFHVALPLA